MTSSMQGHPIVYSGDSPHSAQGHPIAYSRGSSMASDRSLGGSQSRGGGLTGHPITYSGGSMSGSEAFRCLLFSTLIAVRTKVPTAIAFCPGHLASPVGVGEGQWRGFCNWICSRHLTDSQRSLPPDLNSGSRVSKA